MCAGLALNANDISRILCHKKEAGGKDILLKLKIQIWKNNIDIGEYI